jgi:transposase
LKHCQKAASAGQISLFYLDESGFSNLPNVQRAWAPKGQPHAADASGPRRRVNVIGALDWATGQVWHHLHEQTVNRAAVIDLIDGIARREQRMPLTLVVLDNARIHHGIGQEKLDDWMINHRLLLMHLPPYSPELNPIEIVWKQAKYHWRRFVSWSKEQLLEEVHKLMQETGSTYKISFT